MNLTKALSTLKVQTAQPSHATVHFINGKLAADPDNAFLRIHPNPKDNRNYLLIKKDDVQGEVHVWTADELAFSRIVGEQVVRLALPHGAVVQVINVGVHRLGETIGTNIRPAEASRGECNNDSSCPYGCCRVSNSGICYCSACCVG